MTFRPDDILSLQLRFLSHYGCAMKYNKTADPDTTILVATAVARDICVCVRACVPARVYVCVYIYIYIWKEMFYLTTHSTHFIYGYMVQTYG